MKIYTIQDIRDLNPCYDPARFLAENWTGTVLDILDVVECLEIDRIWVTVQLIDAKIVRLYAVWCIREALALIDAPDQRFITVCDVIEQHVHGKVSDVKLAAAVEAARAAAEAAAEAAKAAEAAGAAGAAWAVWATGAAWADAEAAKAAGAAEAAEVAWAAEAAWAAARAAEAAEATKTAEVAGVVQINKLRQLIESESAGRVEGMK